MRRAPGSIIIVEISRIRTFELNVSRDFGDKTLGKILVIVEVDLSNICMKYHEV